MIAPGELDSPPFPVIFAAPSGAGKTSIAQALRRRRDDVVFSISATTRPPREYEREGVDYFFKTEEEFRRMVAEGELLEWAVVHGNLYGTPRANVLTASASRKHLILDIDVQGSRQVRQAVPEAVAIFVLPPSGTELSHRLTGRASEPAETRRKRLRAARAELAAAEEFEYVIVNEDIDEAVGLIEAIIAAESMRTRRLPSLGTFVGRLCKEVDEAVDAEIG